jgi:hypothetical protein
VTSNINYLSINENFPVAGQDNDTQVFRDNFDTIKTSLRVAKEEVTSLQNDVAYTTQDNDFGLYKISNAVLENVRGQKLDTRGDDALRVQPITIDYQSGSYQIYNIGANIVMDFLNFPGDIRIVPAETAPIGWGKVRVELYSDGAGDWNVTFSLSGSGATSIKKDFLSGLQVTAADNTNSPLIIDIWRHRTEEIFISYVGTFA